MTVFIEVLGYDHRLLRGESEFARCFLLERRCGELWRGITAHILYVYFRHAILRTLEPLYNRVGIFLALYPHLAQSFAIYGIEHPEEWRFFSFLGREHCLDRPIFFLVECLYQPLAFDNEPYCDTLHAAGGEPVTNFPPEESGEPLAYKAVNNTPRLLGAYT